MNLKLTLLFNSIDAAEAAWTEHFEDSTTVLHAYFDAHKAAIHIEAYGSDRGQTHLDIPAGLIAIIV